MHTVTSWLTTDRSACKAAALPGQRQPPSTTGHRSALFPPAVGRRHGLCAISSQDRPGCNRDR